jgi:beta-galactosidase GanA
VRDEKNDNELSICDCFVGFLQIDLIYRIYEGVVFRRYKKELDKVFLQWENSEYGNSLGTLRKIWSMKLESLS